MLELVCALCAKPAASQCLSAREHCPAKRHAQVLPSTNRSSRPLVSSVFVCARCVPKVITGRPNRSLPVTAPLHLTRSTGRLRAPRESKRDRSSSSSKKASLNVHTHTCNSRKDESERTNVNAFVRISFFFSLFQFCLARELDERQTHPSLPNGAGSSGVRERSVMGLRRLAVVWAVVRTCATLTTVESGRFAQNQTLTSILRWMDGVSAPSLSRTAQQRNYFRTNKRSFADWHVPVVVVVRSNVDGNADRWEPIGMHAETCSASRTHQG